MNIENIEAIKDIALETTMKKDTQGRNYVFTVNNPKQTEEEFSEYLKSLEHIRYFIFGREKGDGDKDVDASTGTEHYQGYMEFEIPKRFSTIKNYLSTETIGVNAHIQKRKGTKQNCVHYVKKIGDYKDKAHTRMGELYEFGEFNDSGQRSDLTELMDDIEYGLDEIDLSRKHQGKYARHIGWADRFKQQTIVKKYGKMRRLNLEVTYIFGKAGVGKTRHVMDTYGDENVYRITDYDGNVFDNYNNEDIVVFEEYRSQIRIDMMLNFLDIYPLRLTARYNNKVACYTKVFIITNLPLSDQYKKVQESHPETWKAFLRRIHKVFNFDLSKDTQINIATGRLLPQTQLTIESTTPAPTNQNPTTTQNPSTAEILKQYGTPIEIENDDLPF